MSPLRGVWTYHYDLCILVLLWNPVKAVLGYGTWYEVGQHAQSRLDISDDMRILADKFCVSVEQTTS